MTTDTLTKQDRRQALRRHSIPQGGGGDDGPPVALGPSSIPAIAQETTDGRWPPGTPQPQPATSTRPATPAEQVPLDLRTLADIDDSPPEPLLLGMFEPKGPTLLSAAGGIGKGSTMAWAIRELVKTQIRPLVYDAEGHPNEWARRVSGLGVDRNLVDYLQPTDLPRYLLGQPIWEIIPYLETTIRARHNGVFIVDSILAAAGIGEERLKSDAQAPYLYVRALDALQIPSLSLGHPPRANPDGDPYGSVAWVNAMRLTWGGTRAETTTPNLYRVRWRPRKRNERGRISGVLLTFEYDTDGRLLDATREDDDEVTRDWLLSALLTTPKTIKELAEALLDDQGELPEQISPDRQAKTTEERIGRTLRRYKNQPDRWFAKSGDKRGHADLWTLAPSAQGPE